MKLVIGITIILFGLLYFEKTFAMKNDTTQLLQESILVPDTVSGSALGDTIISKDPYLQPYSFFHNTPNPDYKRLAYNSGIIVIGSLFSAGILYLMPEGVSNWDKEEIKKDLFSQWKNNVKSGPHVDKDNWVLNYVSHPYFGAVYYMNSRSTGLSAPVSFLYSAAYSTFFWEYGIEAFAEVPSIQDLIITPVAGSIIGEFFYLGKRSIVARNYHLLGSPILGHTATFLMDPLNEIMDLFGGKFTKKKGVAVEMSSLPAFSLQGKFAFNVQLKVYF